MVKHGLYGATEPLLSPQRFQLMVQWGLLSPLRFPLMVQQDLLSPQPIVSSMIATDGKTWPIVT